MTNASFDAPSDLRDIEARNYWRKLEAAGHEFDDVEEWFRHSRDNARTPVTWTDGPDAGFTDGDPWLDPIEEYRTVNAATDRASGRSILAFYAELIELRGDDVLAYGDFELVASDHEEIYAVHRSLESADHDLLVACNFFDGEPTLRTAPRPRVGRTGPRQLRIASRDTRGSRVPALRGGRPPAAMMASAHRTDVSSRSPVCWRP